MVSSAESPAKVFISYRTADEAHWLPEMLKDKLETYYGRDSVFWDKKSLQPGRWGEQLEAAVTAADVVIVLIGDPEKWLGCVTNSPADERRIDKVDDWVRKEVRLALEQAVPGSGKLVVPLFASASAKLPAGLPPDLQSLGEFQSRQIDWSKGDWAGSQIADFCRWVVRRAPISYERRLLLQRLHDSVKPVEARHALNPHRDRLWVYFRASLGILSRHDELLEEIGGKDRLRIEKMFEILAASPNQLPLLRFLLLVSYYPGAGGKIDLPESVAQVWREQIDGARQPGSDHGWDEISEDVFDDTLEWASGDRGDLRPVLQIYAYRDWASTGTGGELCVAGNVLWGDDRDDLELPGHLKTIKWSDHWSDEEVRAQLQPVFEYLFDRTRDLLGSDQPFPPELVPRIEFFFQKDQIRWPLETLRCGSRTLGAIYRVSRRLYERHFSMPGTADDFQEWREHDSRYREPLQLGQILNEASDWQDLTKLLKRQHLAFAIRGCCEPDHWTHLVPWVAGAWVGCAACDLDDQELLDLFVGCSPDKNEPIDEVARQIRFHVRDPDSPAHGLAVLRDRHGSRQPIPLNFKAVAAEDRDTEEYGY